MKRESLLTGAAVALAIAACASAPPGGGARVSARPFVSDRLTVVTRGTGRDIILLPGLVSHRDVWAGVAERLEDRYRLHLVQVNGFAGLPAGANADGPVAAPVAEEIARYIGEARLSRPAVIGHSLGGSIGLMLAARHPDLVGRLMVVDMPPFVGVMFGPPGATPESVRAVADQIRARILSEPPGSPTGMLEQMIPSMTRIDTMRPMLAQGVRDSDRRTAANAFHEVIVTDLRPELARITAPVTVLYVIPANAPPPADRYEAAMRSSYANARNVRLTRIDDSNHFIQFDQPARFVSEVDTFMRQ